MVQILKLLVIVGLLVAFGAVVYFVYANYLAHLNPLSPKQATVSGIVEIDGLIPNGASVSVAQRPARTTEEFQIFNNSLQVKNDVVWTYQAAQTGQSYEIQAYIVVNGQNIASSDPIEVTAPAANEVIRLQIQTPNQTANATISGNVKVNGYIPSGATITIQGRQMGTITGYTTVVRNLAAQSNQVVTYSTAIAGIQYEVVGILFDSNGQQIGQSSPMLVTAPSENNDLKINSSAVAPTVPASVVPVASSTPAPAMTISGNIDFNGPVPANSSIVVLARQSNTSNNFEVVVNSVQPTDTASWLWNNPQSGIVYDVIAVLKQPQSSGTYVDVATSQIVQMSAPAQNENLVINSSVQIPAPNGQITISCGVHDSSNNWTAVINFQTQLAAQTYWYQVGTTSGGSDLVNTTIASTNNPNQQINVKISDSVIYYARYAYANNQTKNWQDFSPFSGVTQVKCPS